MGKVAKTLSMDHNFDFCLFLFFVVTVVVLLFFFLKRGKARIKIMEICLLTA